MMRRFEGELEGGFGRSGLGQLGRQGLPTGLQGLPTGLSGHLVDCFVGGVEPGFWFN